MADVAVPRRSNVPEIIAALREWFAESAIRETILPITARDRKRPSKEWKTDDGYVTVRYHGLSRFSLEDHTGNTHRNRVAKAAPARYIPSKANVTHERMGRKMPPARGRRQAAPAPEPQNGEVDYQLYLTKDISDTMTDYITWFEDNVAKLEDVPIDRLLVLGSSLYPHFQKSDFNIAQRTARRAARTPAPEPEPAAPAPARGRGRGKPAAKAGTAPAGRRGGRGRQAASAGAGGADPY